ncbi:hypothetical protein AKJ09_04501 [Labilithrix luteola]|uniref:Uncharacterized protein n=1 Tax=Labilithrix luteola TaxID=1391654 RepID=A0A0K1PWE3_9BACT|nr:hypothetical protein AKJ09_04501 [Labilithrix luteola]
MDEASRRTGHARYPFRRRPGRTRPDARRPRGPRDFIETAVPDKVDTFATGELVPTLSPTSDDADLFYSRYHFQGDEVFWVASSSIRSKLKLWTKADGVRRTW